MKKMTLSPLLLLLCACVVGDPTLKTDESNCTSSDTCFEDGEECFTYAERFDTVWPPASNDCRSGFCMAFYLQSNVDFSIIEEEGRCISRECFDPELVVETVEDIPDDAQCPLLDFGVLNQNLPLEGSECCYEHFEILQGYF